MAPRLRQKAILEKTRLAAYSAAAAAAAVAAPGVAQASITYTSVNTLVEDTVLGGGGVALNLPFGSFNLRLAHGLGATNALTGYAFTAGASINPVNVAGFNAGAFNYATNVAYNAPISGLASFLGAATYGTMAFNGGYTYSQFTNPGVGFLGVKFNGTQHGWIRVNMSGNPLNSFTVVDYAFAGPGEVIHAGEVPEPGTLALLAMGAAGLANWRRRKVA